MRSIGLRATTRSSVTDRTGLPALFIGTASGLVLAGLLGFSAAGLTGCNTVEGAGKDVSAAGEAVSDAARDTSDAISGKK